jgi:SSS family solute:Na+ symporter
VDESGGAWFPGGSALTAADYFVLVAALGLMLWLGRRAGRFTRGPEDYFLAGRRVPALAAAVSFLATEVSAMTVIGVPAIAFRENWNYLQFFIGSAAARVLVAYVFLPAFYHLRGETIYDYLRARFGPRAHAAGVFFFFVTRLLASGVRLMAACVAAGVLLGWGVPPTVLLFLAIGAAALWHGGAESTVWTNLLQAACFLGAGALSIVFILRHVDGGIPAAYRIASDAGKLDMFRWIPAPGGFLARVFSDPGVFWVAVLNGFFGSAAAFGTDHEMTQKLLVVRNLRDSRRAVLLSIGLSFLTLMIYLGLGTLLFVYYKQNPGLALPDSIDRIYPHFAATVMPRFLRGMVLTAIVMASIDSPLASLSAVFVSDVYRPLVGRRATPAAELKLARRALVAFTVVLGVAALLFNHYNGSLWLAFKIGGVTYGSLLGVYLLGLLTDRELDGGAAGAMVFAAVLNLALLIASEKGSIGLGWSWLVALGSAVTFGLGWLLGKPGKPRAKHAH